MAHATPTRHTSKALVAAGLAGVVLAGAAHPAAAGVNPGYNNTARPAVRQDENWETMSNASMRQVYRQPANWLQPGFCVVAGNRWDSGTFFGAPWGNVEARAFVLADSMAGLCTLRLPAAYLHVNTSPVFTDGASTVRFADRGCVAGRFEWNTWEAVAWTGQYACSAPTYSGAYSNYLTGGYSANVTVDGQAFPDWPGSRFHAQWANSSARRY